MGGMLAGMTESVLQSGVKANLHRYLQAAREALLWKLDGLSEYDIRRPMTPTGTNLLGLVKHLTYVERHWLLGHDVTDWPATFHAGPTDTTDTVLASYKETIAEANREIASWDDLGEPGPRRGRSRPSRRWTLTHMIEETARHAGHADILRELIDGATGR